MKHIEITVSTKAVASKIVSFQKALMKRIRRKQLEKKLEAEKQFLRDNIDIIPSAYKKIIASYYPDAHIRKQYLSDLGVIFGDKSFVNLGFIKIPTKDSKNKIYIGNNVSIAPNVTCICESTPNNGVEINSYPYIKDTAVRSLDIHIEDDVWIGADVTILPGVTIGKCAVIGAGSVVTKDVEPYGVYAGVPAKKIKDIRFTITK